MAAVALGACVIEKHVTLDRALPGPDHAASLTPDELRALVDGIRSVEAALGDGVKRLQPSEQDAARTLQKTVVTRCALAAGEVLSNENLAARRTLGGVPAAELPRLIGRRTRRALAENEPVTPDALE